MKRTERFLNIPIPMLKGLYENSEKFFKDVFDVGIYLYSKTLEHDFESFKTWFDAL